MVLCNNPGSKPGVGKQIYAMVFEFIKHFHPLDAISRKSDNNVQQSTLFPRKYGWSAVFLGPVIADESLERFDYGSETIQPN